MTTQNNLTPAIAANMLHGIEKEKDPQALLELACEQSLARDIRRAAADRLNDIREALAYIANLNDITLLGKIARCNFLQSKFTAAAKGRIISVGVNSVDNLIERIVAAVEEQNRLLRQLAGGK